MMLKLSRREEDLSESLYDSQKIIQTITQTLVELVEIPDCAPEEVYRFLDLWMEHYPGSRTANGVKLPAEVVNVISRTNNVKFVEILFDYDKDINWTSFLSVLFSKRSSLDVVLRVIEYLYKEHHPYARQNFSRLITYFHRIVPSPEEVEKLCRFMLNDYISIGMSDIFNAAPFAYILISYTSDPDMVFKIFDSIRGFFLPYDFYSDDIFYIPRDKLDLDILMRLFEFSYSDVCTGDVPKLCHLYAEANRFDIAAVCVVFCNGGRNVPSDFQNCLEELYTITSMNDENDIGRLVPYVDTLESIDKKGMFLDTLLYECAEKDNVHGMKAIFSLFGMSTLNHPLINVEETIYWSSNNDMKNVIKYLIDLGIEPKDFWVFLFKRICIYKPASAAAIIEALPLTKDELLQLRNYVERLYLPLNTEKILLKSIDEAGD